MKRFMIYELDEKMLWDKLSFSLIRKSFTIQSKPRSPTYKYVLLRTAVYIDQYEYLKTLRND